MKKSSLGHIQEQVEELKDEKDGRTIRSRLIVNMNN